MLSFSTLERKKAHVLAADDGSFFVELRAFLRWALADAVLREHMASLLEPPEEVRAFVAAVPSLIADARNVAHWLRAEAPAACAAVGNDAHWAEFDRLVGLMDSPERRSLHDLTEITEVVFTTLRAVREAVGRSVMGKNDEERVAAWRTAVDLANAYDHRMKERELADEASPGVALSRLMALCRAISTPPDGTSHWTDFAPADVQGRFSVRSLQTGVRDAPAVWVAFARGAFGRFFEGLLTSLEDGLSLRQSLQRFRERSLRFDRDRLRRLATVEGEEGLTMDLGRYLYDRGLVPPARAVLVGKMDDAPRVVAKVRELGTEAKADGTGPAAMVVFVIHGPVCVVPDTIQDGTQRIFAEVVDLVPPAGVERETLRVPSIILEDNS